MEKTLEIEARTTAETMVVFVDLTGYMKESRREEEQRLELLAETMDALYERIAGHVEKGGGRVVKFIGDAALAVFPGPSLDGAVRALLEMKDDVDRWLASRGWRSQLIVKAHFGPVMAGPFGGRGDKRFDVIGSTVNIAATLQGGGDVAISAQVFRKLSDGSRRLFKRWTSPTVYVRADGREGL